VCLAGALGAAAPEGRETGGRRSPSAVMNRARPLMMAAAAERVGTAPYRRLVASIAACAQLRMLTARAATTATVSSDATDWVAIRSFARGLSGMVSVGLKAVAFVRLT